MAYTRSIQGSRRSGKIVSQIGRWSSNRAFDDALWRPAASAGRDALQPPHAGKAIMGGIGNDRQIPITTDLDREFAKKAALFGTIGSDEDGNLLGDEPIVRQSKPLQV
ncbi:hypothetical protein [Agrobacterium pusense]|uniref:hypothetical protein n=2 Tax=Hyphomicrobiales TaxID=356 RepID=UPI001EF0356A|nr:hypothetical protein [Agrobacterium pusense]MDH0873635.1 hypothetical protein [Agrobacterium pusense]